MCQFYGVKSVGCTNTCTGHAGTAGIPWHRMVFKGGCVACDGPSLSQDNGLLRCTECCPSVAVWPEAACIVLQLLGAQ